jgi:integrase
MGKLVVKLEEPKAALNDPLERFLADCKPTTRQTYRFAFEKHFIPFISTFEFQGQRIPLTPRKFLDIIRIDQAKPLDEKQLINNRVSAVQSFANYWGLNISTKFIQLPEPIALTKSFAWTTEKFEQFNLLLEKPIYRALDACLFQSGLGISDVLCRTYGEIKMEFEKGTVPICLNVVRIKTKIQHRTFLGPEAATLLKAYFKGRRRPKPDELIFDIKKRVVDATFSVAAHKLIGEWEYRNPMSPHSRRKFFRKKLVKEGKCPSEYAEYFMGHALKSDMRKVYSEMSDDEWAEIYTEYMPYLSFRILEPKAIEIKAGQ